MTTNPQKLRLPFLIAIIGTFLSIFVFIILKNNLSAYLQTHNQVHVYLPWIILVSSLSFVFLIAILIRMAQLAQLHAHILKQTNENLKNEINERIGIEETKQTLEAALLQGQKLQAMGTLAGGIAHDFNNILYAIIGYTEMARSDLEKHNLIYKNLGKVLDGAHKGQELISRILAFSRRQHQHFDPINLKKTIETALSLLRPTIPASVIVNFEPIETTILGNQTQMHQVLINLINNAVDAMDGEGTINIRMRTVASDDPSLKQFPEAIAENYCKIEISDTGQGMDQTTMARIYEPFFTTKEVGKGTGLGLSIAHSIIKEHRGEISAVSRLGQGTTFTILLRQYEV